MEAPHDNLTPRGGSDEAHLALAWEVVQNGLQGDRCLLQITLTNQGSQPFGQASWAIYFNGVNRPEPGSATGGASVELVNGDLYRLAPSEGFGTLQPGESRVVRYVGSAWAIQHTDAPRGAFIVYDEGTPLARALAIGDAVVGAFVRREQLMRNAHDELPHYDAARAYRDNDALRRLPASEVGKITPTPLRFGLAQGELELDDETCVEYEAPLVAEAELLCDSLGEVLGREVFATLAPTERSIRLAIDESLVSPPGTVAREAYRVDVGAGGVLITGASAEAVFRGIQTLKQLLPVDAWRSPRQVLELPCCSVFDAPRFGYRGLLVDVARNFSSKQTLFRVLELMALYKLNRLHLHLTDDEGWRVAIPSLPELTEHGAQRGFLPGEPTCLPPSFGSGPSTAAPGSGFYSRDDFVEILRFATARHIAVVPEIDVPGHARAAIRAMEARSRRLLAEGRSAEAEAYLLSDLDDASSYRSEQGFRDNVVCVGLESCYAFLDAVVRELKAMFNAAAAPLRTIHFGGDEIPLGCWERSPKCRAFMLEHGLADQQALRDYFYERLHGLLASHHLELAGWEEIALLRGAKRDPRPKANPKFVDSGFIPYVWNNAPGWGREDVAHRLANAGYRVVLCNVAHLYLDFAYDKTPEEPGYYWAGFVNARKVFELCPLNHLASATRTPFGGAIDPDLANDIEPLRADAVSRVLGIQGQLWGENLRTAVTVEYLLLPRLVPLAERAWASDPNWHLIEDVPARQVEIGRAWNELANRLGQRELPRLDGLLGGVAYRVPVPGAVLREGELHANVCLPGFSLRYTTDGEEPTLESATYEGPVPAEQARVAAFTTTGRRGRSVTAR